MSNVSVVFRYGTALQWQQRNTLLLPGEAGYEIDTDKFKVGKPGGIRWNDLGYFAGGGGSSSSPDNMLKSIYDAGSTGIVNDSRKLGGNLPAYYLSRGNHEGSIAAGLINNVGTSSLLGRFSAGNGAAEGITLGAGLNLTTAGVLSATSSGIGSSVAGGTPKSVLFVDADGKFQQSNLNFNFDLATNTLKATVLSTPNLQIGAEGLKTSSDTANYFTTQISLTGGVSFDAVGANPKFIFAKPVEVPDDAYSAAGWDGNFGVPSKNAIRDKFVLVEASIASAGGGDMLKSQNLSGLADYSNARTNLGLGTLATQSGTFSGTSSGTNTGDETTVTIKTKLGAASASQDGYLTQANWNAFNNNQNALPVVNLATYAGSDPTNTAAVTAGINQFFAYLAANPKSIGYIPPGSWRTNGGHTLPFETNLICSGRLLMVANNTFLVKLQGVAGSPIVNFYADNLKLDLGTTTGTTGFLLTGDGSTPMFNITLHNLAIYGGAVSFNYLSASNDMEVENLKFTGVTYFFYGQTQYKCNSINNSVIFDYCYSYLPLAGTWLDIIRCGALHIHGFLCTGTQTAVAHVPASDGSTILKLTEGFNEISISGGQDENVEYFLVKNGGNYYPGRLALRDNAIQSKLHFNAGVNVTSRNNTYVSNGTNYLYRNAAGVGAFIDSDSDYFENRDNAGTILTTHIADAFTATSYFVERNDAPYAAGANYTKTRRHFSYHSLHPNLNAVTIATTPAFPTTIAATTGKQAATTFEVEDPGHPIIQLREKSGANTFAWNIFRNPNTGSLVFQGNQSGFANYEFDGWITATGSNYGAGWNNSARLATEGSIYSKIESLGSGAFTTEVSVRNTLNTQLRIGGANTTDVYTIGRNVTAGASLGFLEFIGLQTDRTFVGYRFDARLQARAGEGTLFAKAGGTLFDYTADAVSGAVGIETDIFTDTIPANTLQKEGDKLAAKYVGAFALTTSLKNLKVYFGTTVLANFVDIDQNGGAWEIEVLTMKITNGIGSTVKLSRVGYTETKYAKTSTFGLGFDKILRCVGFGDSAGDVTGKMGYVEWKASRI